MYQASIVGLQADDRYARIIKVQLYPDSESIVKIKVVIWQEDGVWCGSVPALPGCHTWGESCEHLLEMLVEAIEGWLEVASQTEEVEPEQQLIERSV